MRTTSTNPLVSVVLPTWNRAATLGRSIASVLGQTFEDFELIVVDDASDDGTEAVVDSFPDPRLRYVALRVHGGASAARNVGAKLARGSYLAFQDSDDEWLATKLAEQVRRAKDDWPRREVVYCGFLWIKGTSATYIPDKDVKQREGSIYGELLRDNFVSPQTLLVKRGAFEEIGGFDEDLAKFGDWDLALRLAQRYEFACVDKPLVKVYHTRGSLSDRTDLTAAALERILGKYRQDFARNPSVLAAQLRELGRLLLEDGFRERAILAVAHGLKAHWDLAGVAALLMALGGVRAFRLGTSVLARVHGDGD